LRMGIVDFVDEPAESPTSKALSPTRSMRIRSRRPLVEVEWPQLLRSSITPWPRPSPEDQPRLTVLGSVRAFASELPTSDCGIAHAHQLI
jgi:hypothetical protein